MSENSSSTDPTLTPEDDSILPKAYDSAAVEGHWYAVWNDAGVFTAQANDVLTGGKKPYVIMMPPPNVTGSLHMGHALFITLQDILTRQARMRGMATLWLPGVDHAGIATQTVVERELKRHENKNRHDLGREEFLKRVWAWKEKSGGRIVEQLKGMGASADWSRERFTMDAQCSTAVTEAFVKMWNDGLIYRGERLVNWDPATQTALSDEEVESEDKEGELWRFAYRLQGSDAEIVVATTRVETMLGDVAVAVHPDDERYRNMVGKRLVHPFCPDRVVVIIADASVDPAFGTGAVKITPAHDPNDFDMGQRHSLPMINILNLDATLNENGADFAGLERFEARRRVKAKLEELGFFRGTDKIRHAVPTSQRMLSRQFFVRTKPLAEASLAATRSGETRIIPAFWEKTWEHWMVNIRDWCISRQLWWGHRIPVFYDLDKIDEVLEADGNRKGNNTAAVQAQAKGVRGKELLRIVLASVDDDLVMKMCVASTTNLEQQHPGRYLQEEDVLDTWYSSGLWPFSTLGWPQQTDDLKAFYPGAVLETGSDILFFWVARMVMMGTYFMGKSPFADVFLHAIVRDANGKKMSKSEGNALDPLDVISGITLPDLIAKTKTYPVPEKKLASVLKNIEKEFPDGIPAAGADGLRFTLAALSSHGRDVKLSIPRAAGYRAFLNKIWNATRFALMRIGDDKILPLAQVRAHLSLADQAILSKLQKVIAAVDTSIAEYRFDATANESYQFFWIEFCDAYIELVKPALDADAPADARQAARATLMTVLDTSMRLLHPIAPFVTEEIWQKLPGRASRHDAVFCCTAPWPTVDSGLINDDAEREQAKCLAVVTLIRNVRQESGLSPRKPVIVDVLCDDEHDRALLQRRHELIGRLAATETLTVRSRVGYAPPALAAVHANGGVEVVVHLAGLIDVSKERERLERELVKTDKDLQVMQRRFDNADFVAKAPPEVVAQGRLDIAALSSKQVSLQSALSRLPPA
jgi:valyl-tRNA synthetase